MALKTYHANDDIPDDFWNYNLNIITGFNLDKVTLEPYEMEKKYNRITQPLTK